ncbi:MAG: DoxX family protein [Polyangiaceae bacterium]
MKTKALHQPYRLLKLTFGVVPIVAGLDKFTNLLTNWEQYLNPLLARAVPPFAFLRVIGVVEIVAGLVVLSKFTRLGAYVVAAWLVGIALNLLSSGHFLDVAVRDLVMAVGALTLAKLEGAGATRAPEKEGPAASFWREPAR